MELTNIFNKITKNQHHPRQFIAIEISSEIVKTAIWQVVNHKTHVVSTGTVEEWKGNNPEDLLTAVDVSLSKALEGIDPEPNDVIFGLPEAWVKDDTILEDRKPFLKILAQKLNLTPVGFVVSTEALVHYLKEREGGPPTTILLNLSEIEVAVTLVRLGKIDGTNTVSRSEDLGADVEEGLARFPGIDNLPSRMLVYDGNIDLESAKQVLLSYNWQEKLPFLHFPKIDSLTNDITIRAVAIAGGAEVAKSLGFDIREPDQEPSEPPAAIPTPKTSDIPDKAQAFGFNSQLARPQPPTTTPESPSFPEPSSEPPAQTISKKTEAQPSLERETPETPSTTPEPKPVPQASFLAMLTSILEKPKALLSQKVPLTLPQFSNLPPLLPLGLGFIFIAFIAAFIAYWNLPTATVTVFLEPKIINQEVDFTLDPTVSVLDVNKSLIPAQEESVEVDGQKEAATTGNKLVGERATGEVKIYNNTTSPKSFPAGTRLTTSAGLRFTLDSDVSLASASTQKISPGETKITAGEATTPVVASDIGAEYNISANESLTVADFAKTSFEAIATNTFSGGSSRQIQAVSQEDQDNLLAALKEELTQKAIDKLKFRSDEIQEVIPTGEVKEVETDFSAQEGDEVKNFQLNLKISLQAYTYQVADVNLLVENILGENVPSNYQLDQEASEIEVLDAQLPEADETQLKVKAKVKVKLIPQLDPNDIAANIKGKYPPVTQSYFSSLPNFAKVETQIKPHLPGRLGTFPRRADHITIEIKLKED